MVPDMDWDLPAPRRNSPQTVFESTMAEGKYPAFRYFEPSYHGPDEEELERISKLYAAFAFRKARWLLLL
jgi:hypothetical protein